MGRTTAASLIIALYLLPYVIADVPPGAIIGITFASFIGFCVMVVAGICCYIRVHSRVTRRRHSTPTGNAETTSEATVPTPLTTVESIRTGNTSEISHESTNGRSSSMERRLASTDNELAPPPPYQSLDTNVVMDEQQPPSYADVSGGEIRRDADTISGSHEAQPPSYDTFVERQLSRYSAYHVTYQSRSTTETDPGFDMLTGSGYVPSHSPSNGYQPENVSRIFPGDTSQSNRCISPTENIAFNIGNLSRSREENNPATIPEYDDFAGTMVHGANQLPLYMNPSVSDEGTEEVSGSSQSSSSFSDIGTDISEPNFINSRSITSENVSSEIGHFSRCSDENEAGHSRRGITDRSSSHGIYLDSLEELGNQRIEQFTSRIGPLSSGSLIGDSSLFDESFRSDSSNILDTMEEIAQERHEQFSTTPHGEATNQFSDIGTDISEPNSINSRSTTSENVSSEVGQFSRRSDENEAGHSRRGITDSSPSHGIYLDSLEELGNQRIEQFTSRIGPLSSGSLICDSSLFDESFRSDSSNILDTLEEIAQERHEQFSTTPHGEATNQDPAISGSMPINNGSSQTSGVMGGGYRSPGAAAPIGTENIHTSEFIGTSGDFSRLEALIEAHASSTLPVNSPINSHSVTSDTYSYNNDLLDDGSRDSDPDFVDTLPTYEEAVSSHWAAHPGTE